KNKTPLHENTHEALKELRAWVKSWSSVIFDYIEHYDSKVRPWIEICQQLYHWVEKRLDPSSGMTFGDIEYHVALGLEDVEARKRVNKSYNYFIVDEFQDTSFLQFEIIKSLIDNDFKR